MEKVTALDGAKIADAVYRFDNEVGVYEIVTDEDTKQQITYDNPNTNLQLALYQNSITGDYVIAIRGTELGTYGDNATNIAMFFSTFVDTIPTVFVEALQVLDPIIEDYGLNDSNTTIVGHSMGGSIAQYLGSVKGFETLTYNAYGIGNMDMAPNSSGENITNYITMHDFVCVLPGSEMIGQTYMLQDETLMRVFGHGIKNFIDEANWVRGYSFVDDPRSIDVIDGLGADWDYELELMKAEGREFAMIGGSMDDVIYGSDMDIDNVLIGGSGDDILIGGSGSDTYYGGKDYDIYITGDDDYIKDEDGDGKVIFEDTKLTGGTREACNPNDPGAEVVYKGDGGEYTWSGGDLVFEQDGKFLIIDNFKNGDLDIVLSERSPCPALPPMPEAPLMPAGPNFPSPLTLDLNGDGVTSTFIYDTKSYFDLNNDGMRERTGWVQSEDALLVFDANQNGIIDNGSELFGNNTYLSNGTKAANGFEALAQYDENKDGIIDSNDNIYSVLQLWQDTNSNGTTDAGELHSLGELGVATINLSYATIDALEERNSIFQTSIFTTTDGDTQIINDVWFDTDAQDTLRVYGGTLSDTVAALPDFKASGRVENLSIAMNENSGLEEAA